MSKTLLTSPFPARLLGSREPRPRGEVTVAIVQALNGSWGRVDRMGFILQARACTPSYNVCEAEPPDSKGGVKAPPACVPKMACHPPSRPPSAILSCTSNLCLLTGSCRRQRPAPPLHAPPDPERPLTLRPPTSLSPQRQASFGNRSHTRHSSRLARVPTPWAAAWLPVRPPPPARGCSGKDRSVASSGHHLVST